MTRQFFEASGPQGHFFQQKNNFFRYGLGGVPNFRAVQSLVRPGIGHKQTNKPAHAHICDQIKENTHRLRPVDFDIKSNLNINLGGNYRNNKNLGQNILYVNDKHDFKLFLRMKRNPRFL